jgi:hypothetical protein
MPLFQSDLPASHTRMLPSQIDPHAIHHAQPMPHYPNAMYVALNAYSFTSDSQCTQQWIYDSLSRNLHRGGGQIRRKFRPSFASFASCPSDSSPWPMGFRCPEPGCILVAGHPSFWGRQPALGGRGTQRETGSPHGRASSGVRRNHRAAACASRRRWWT